MRLTKTYIVGKYWPISFTFPCTRQKTSNFRPNFKKTYGCAKGQKFEVFCPVHGNATLIGQYFPTIYALVSVNCHPNISLEALLLALREEKMMKNFDSRLWVFHCLTQVRDSNSQGCKGTLVGLFRPMLESMTQSHDRGVGGRSSHFLNP